MRWAAAALLIAVATTVPAEATVDHTYVSGKGTDTGECESPPIACRTFAYALSQTAASGEIIVLDPADYSPVTITKSISLVADSSGPAGIILPTAMLSPSMRDPRREFLSPPPRVRSLPTR
jgi:hypothetical protein